MTACAGDPDIEVRRSTVVDRSAPFLESGGQVVMEAENATGAAPGTGPAARATWTVRSFTRASAGVALEAAPNAGVRTGDATVGPRQDYAVRFARAGTYYVWVRTWGPSSEDDTVHIGLDGVPASAGTSGVIGPGTTWGWVNRVGSRRLTVTVASARLRTVNVWMREDGVRVDKLLLTTDPSFVPSGTGPDESPRDAATDAGAPSGPDAAPVPTELSFRESGGQVVMEAERATGSAAGSGIASSATWTGRTVSTASNGAAMEATPNAGVRTGDTIAGPRLDYRVRFATAGTYYLWIRARGPSSEDDTFHAGMNGSAATFGASGLLVPTGWTWMNRVGSRRVTVTVTSAGLATINVWMREDGVVVDKLLLTTDASLVPSGTGPAESPRGSETSSPGADGGTSDGGDGGSTPHDATTPTTIATALPPGHAFCDASCLAAPPVEITVCPATAPGCRPTRSTLVTWTVDGRAFTGLQLALFFPNAMARVDAGSATSETSYLVNVFSARAIVRADLDGTISHYDVPPAWGGETRLPFVSHQQTTGNTTTYVYRFEGHATDLAEQIHAEALSCSAEQRATVDIVPLEPVRAFIAPTEVADFTGEGNVSYGNGMLSVNYGNPGYWSGSGNSPFTITRHEFAHEYAHELFSEVWQSFGGNSSCLNEGLADALGVIVGRMPERELGPVGVRGIDYAGDCSRSPAAHDIGNCYFYHLRRAGLLDGTFLRGVFHPRHTYSFDSCTPLDRRTGDSLLVLFSEAAGRDVRDVLDSMNVPHSGSYEAAKASLGF